MSEKTYDIESSLAFEDISKPHYTFGGWFDNQNCFGNATTKIAVGNVGDKTYYAKWVAVEYYVTYHLNGGNNSELNANDNGKYKYTIESDEFEFKAPSRKNYTFDGWYADADFEGESVSALKKGAHGNFDLYAKWIVEKFAITYELGGGVNDQNNPTYTSAEGEEIVLLPATREHYEFARWKNKQNQTVQKIEKGRAEEIYLIAEWKAKEYGIEYELGGGVNADNENSYTVEDDDFLLIAPSRNGYAFDGWYFEEDYSGNKVEKIDCSLGKNLKVYAKWSVVGYAIEYDVNGGENVQNPTEYTVESDDILLNAPTRVGYEFEGWFDKANNVVEKIEKGSVGNISLKAKWRAIKYVISFDSGCEIGVASVEYTVESEDITIEELKRNHYIFGGWFVDESKIERIVKGSHGDLILTARWTENIVVPLSDFAVENGVVTAYNGSATSITIKATEGGEKVVSIAKNTFDDVRTTVTEIYIEEGIQSVEVGAFDGMTALQTLVLPSTITIMHKGMLQDCASLVNLTIPFASFAVDNKEDTQARAFTDSNDGKYAYGIAYLFGTPDDSVRDKFGDYTPYYMNFESGNTVMDDNTICIPISLTNLTVLGGNIIKKCFASMLNLQSVIIKGQSSIGQQAFSKCSSLKEVRIENENSTFGSAVFAGCSDMTIYVASDEQKSTLDGQISALTNVTCTVA